MKKPFIYLLTAGLAFSMIANTGTISAEDKQSQSDATVTFTAPTSFDVVKPLDPENPNLGENQDELDGSVPVEGSALSIDYVSNLRFDSTEATISEHVLKSTTPEPYVQISDRRVNERGWTLSAEASSFTSDKSNGKSTLNGATISFNGTQVKAQSEVAKNIEKPSLDSTASIDLITGSESATPIANARAISEREGETPQGLGTWLFTWLDDEQEAEIDHVTLTVPAATATDGLHTSNITWTLTDGPNNGLEGSENLEDEIQE